MRTGIKASGTVKSPLLLAQFRAGGGASGVARDARDVARAATSISLGVFAVADVDALERKLEPDPSAQGAVRVEGLVEPSGEGFQFTGEVFDLAGGIGVQAFLPLPPRGGAPDDAPVRGRRARSAHRRAGHLRDQDRLHPLRQDA